MGVRAFPGPYAAIRFMEGQNTDLEYWKRLGKYAMNIHSLMPRSALWRDKTQIWNTGSVLENMQ